MIKPFAVFFETIHRTEIVPLAGVVTNNSLFIRYVDSANRIAVGLFTGTAAPCGFCWRFIGRGQRDNNAVAYVQQQAPYK